MGILCGIDEAGRGPIAGPLVVAGAILNNPIDGLNDSKKLSEKKRDELFEIIKKNATYHIVFVDNKTLDEIGISKALKNSITEIMLSLKSDSYLMDGNTSFGIQNLEYMIKADGKVAEVSAASILAKVSRDQYMYEIAHNYPNYSFLKHKGYGTKLHIEEIRNYGYSDIHRTSFKIKSLEQPSLF